MSDSISDAVQLLITMEVHQHIGPLIQDIISECLVVSLINSYCQNGP
jgi:hypothetical protein